MEADIAMKPARTNGKATMMPASINIVKALYSSKVFSESANYTPILSRQHRLRSGHSGSQLHVIPILYA